MYSAPEPTIRTITKTVTKTETVVVTATPSPEPSAQPSVSAEPTPSVEASEEPSPVAEPTPSAEPTVAGEVPDVQAESGSGGSGSGVLKSVAIGGGIIGVAGVALGSIALLRRRAL